MRAISGDSPIRPAPSSEAVGSSIGETFPGQDEIDHRLEEDLARHGKLEEVADPVRVKKRIAQRPGGSQGLGLPAEQQNDRSALTLLALLDLKPTTPWAKAQDPLCGITPMMDFFAKHYGKKYKPNTRETVRRHSVHQFVQAGSPCRIPTNPHADQ